MNANVDVPGDSLQARFFDGRHSRPHVARLRLHDGQLTVSPLASIADADADANADANANRQSAFTPLIVPAAQVRWPERTRHGGRLAQLPGGASLQAVDVAAWDAWVAQHRPVRESWVVRMQQNWRSVAVSLVLLFAALAAMYQWGLPWVAVGVTALVPQRVDALIGDGVLDSIDRNLTKPSELPAADQARIRRAFAQMVERAHPDDAPPWKLEFRAARDKDLGPNALALPGGTIVLTDELVRLLPGDDNAVLGVLGHDFGHVRLRHTMRQLVQASAVGFATSVAFGDYGTLIGSAPVLLATLGYSRDAEREADTESVRLMRAVGISPSVMVNFFQAVERWRSEKKSGEKSGEKSGDGGEGSIGMAFSTHPATADRIAFFRNAAQE